MTTKVTGKVPGVGSVKFEMRNCSNGATCNQTLFCAAANISGVVESCQVSCCFGNICNADTIPNTGTGFTATGIASGVGGSFAGLAGTFVIYKWFKKWLRDNESS
jgi:hypothetical protein